MNKPSASTGVLEFVNLALAIFAWLFSDIQFQYKVTITVVLVGIIVLSKFKLASWLGGLSIRPVTALIGFPVVSSVVMYHLASLCWTRDLREVASTAKPLPLSLVYGLLIGLPIVIISATLFKRNYFGINLGLVGSVLWFFSFYGLVNLGGDFNMWTVSVFGPLVYAFAGNQCNFYFDSNNIFIDILVVGVGLFFVPVVFYYFGVIWRSKNGLLWK